MPTYKYKGKNANGQQIEGTVKAVDKTSASIAAKKEVEIIDSIKEFSDSDDILARFKKAKINLKNLSLICRQFAIILHAGLPIITSIRLVGNQIEDEQLKNIFLDVCEEVKGGTGVADAFEQRDEEFPTTFIETIRAGEQSGKLDIAFDSLASYFTKRSNTASKVKSALIYPIIVLAIAVVVVGILMVFAVPSFTKTFADLGTELPWVTKALIAMSDFFVKYTWVLLIIGLVAYIGFRIYIQDDQGKYRVDQFKLTVPVLGKVRKMSAAAEFANTFSTMLSSGVPAIKALKITGKSISNYSVSQDVINSCALVEGGYKIGDSLKQSTSLPELLLEIVTVGENSGSMESTLAVIAEFYDNEVDTATANAVAVLEPAMIIILAVIVCFVLLSVYLPMFSMYGSL